MMLKRNVYTALISTVFSLPLLAWGMENQIEEPSINWVFEAPSSYTKEEFSSVGLNGDVNPITSKMVVSEGMVYFTTYEGEAYAVDEHDGSLIWSSNLFENYGWEMALHEDQVFFGEGLITDLTRETGSQVVSLNKKNGEQVWSYTTSEFSGILGIVTHGENVIFSTANNLYALNKDSGKEKWKLSFVDRPKFISAKGGLVFFQDNSMSVYVLNADSGEIIFHYESDVDNDYSPRGSIALYEENIIFASGSRESNFIRSYNIDGKENWRKPLDGISLSSIVVDDCCAFFGTEKDQESTFHSISLSSGETIWSRENKEFVRHTPLIAEEKLYFSDKSDRVISIYKEDGELDWSFNIEGNVYTPIVSSSSDLFFGTFEGAVYSIKEP